MEVVALSPSVPPVVTSGADKFEDRAAALWGGEIASALCRLGGLQLGRSQRDGRAKYLLSEVRLADDLQHSDNTSPCEWGSETRA